MKVNESFMSAKEVAEEFFGGLWSYQKVLRWVRNGDLPGVKAGKSYLFSRAALEQWKEVNFSSVAWAKIKLN